MPQLLQEYTTYFTPKKLRVVRNNFIGQGVDNFTQPPAQDPDMFEQLTNVQPVADNILERRWGYTLWANSPLVQSQHMYEYQSLTAGLRYILQCTADGTGVKSATNRITAYSEAGANVTDVFTPSSGATKPFMVLSRDYAYFTDGITADLQKWNGTALSKWGIAAPTTAPLLTAQGSSTAVWQAATIFSTMGLTVDTNNNVQQLTSVSQVAANTTQFGTSGNGQPTWAGVGSNTSDGPLSWTNVGQIGSWQGSTVYAENQPIYDPVSGGLYICIGPSTSGQTTTGGVQPKFTGIPGSTATEQGNLFWVCIGNPTIPSAVYNANVWQPSFQYQKFFFNTVNALLFNNGGLSGIMPFHCGIVEPIPLPSTRNTPLPTQPIFLQLNLTASGKSGTAGAPKWATVVGQSVVDNQLQWTMLDAAAWPANTAVQQWLNPTVAAFSAIKDTNGNMQVCTVSGTTGAAHPTWATGFGQTTTDNTATWVNVGVPITWLANTPFFLPTNGFSPPSNVSPDGTASIKDSNNNIQFVTATGKSGATAPTWATADGSTTADGTITWTKQGAFVALTGNITLTVGVSYFVIFGNANTGELSDLSPVSAFTGVLTNDAVILTNLPVSSDAQVTDTIILRTADGGDQTTLYFVGGVTNGVTTFTDNTSAQNLLTNNIYQETDPFGNLIGVANNQPPPNGSHPIYHRGRLYMLSGSTLFFSKSLQDLTTSTGKIAGRFESCWPPAYQLQLSSIAETPKGIATDGVALYIGTERQVHRLLGDGPTNYGQPEIVFDKVGINNEETWKTVFVQGQPQGMMWLTPDNRVIASDFNTYFDAGHPIQTTLNSINNAAAQNAWAMFVSQGPYDLYMLFMPTGSHTVPDTVCVYNMRSQRWVVWQLTDTCSAGVFNINATGLTQWIISASTGVAYKFISTGFQDRQGNTPVSYATTVRTSWFSPYDFSVAKALNELKILSDDSSILITLEGARSSADFITPTALVSAAAPTTNLWGDLMFGLVSQPCKFQYFRLTATATSTVQNFLRGYSIEVIPLSRV